MSSSPRTPSALQMLRHEMAARAIRVERLQAEFSGAALADELRHWIDKMDEVLAQPSETAPATGDTPRTDAVKWEQFGSQVLEGRDCALILHARQLEREVEHYRKGMANWKSTAEQKDVQLASMAAAINTMNQAQPSAIATNTWKHVYDVVERNVAWIDRDAKHVAVVRKGKEYMLTLPELPNE